MMKIRVTPPASLRDSTPARAALALCGTLVLLAAGCGEEAPPEAPVARPVKLLTLGGDQATRRLEYPGQVEATQHADLGFEVPGQIVEFPVEEGQEVVAGAVLARIDPRDYEAELDARKAMMNAAQAELSRSQVLFDREVTSKQELDRARRNFEVTQAQVRVAEKAVADTALRAPFAGRVARKLVKDFRNVQAKEPVLILQDDSSLELVVNIPERDWALQRGNRTPEQRKALRPRVTISTYPDRDFPASVKEVATTADPATRTYAVTLVFEKPSDIIVLPGMTAKVSVDVPGEVTGAGFAVPVNAVLSDAEGRPYVWRVEPESMTVGKALVEVGAVSGERIEIRRGLEPGDRIAVSGVQQLREGSPVRPFGQ
ncbi:MAG TPA: efflux RND transporter periplasmic adaptor subunit [Myxococcota bacterium]